MSRRRYAPPTILNVGAGIPDGPRWSVPWTRQGCRVLRNGYAFAHMRRSTTPGTARRHTQVPPYEWDGVCSGFGGNGKAAVHHPSRGGGRRPYVVPCPITYPPHNHAGQSVHVRRGRRPKAVSLGPLGQFTFCPHRPARRTIHHRTPCRCTPHRFRLRALVNATRYRRDDVGIVPYRVHTMIRTPNEMGYRAGETGKPPPTTP